MPLPTHFLPGSLGLAIALAITALPAVAASVAPAEAEFAIKNALRPGAKAAHCPADQATPDGCTFHTQTGSVNRARLPATPGATWVARTPDAALVAIQSAGEETGAG